jgi:hypothetical protein
MDRPVWLRWLGALAVVALLVLIGVWIYDLGVARGLAEGANVAGFGARDGPFIGWWRPWGFGFGFFPFFPFLILLWLVLRAFVWRGPWYGRRWYARGYGPGWNDGRDGVPPAFEEWHRRAHGQREPPPAGTKA